MHRLPINAAEESSNLKETDLPKVSMTELNNGDGCYTHLGVIYMSDFRVQYRSKLGQF